MCTVNFRAKIAQRTYDFLDIGKSPHLADCIFALSGNQQQKTYAIRMWRFGYAAQLILSVGRFDWQKFGELNLESDGGLEAMAAQAPLKKRHFLVRVDRQEASCLPVRMGPLGIRSEARALAEHFRNAPVRSLLIVSLPAYLRRSALAFRRAFRKSGVRLTFVAVPEKVSFDTPASRAPVWSEFRKYLLSRLLFPF